MSYIDNSSNEPWLVLNEEIASSLHLQALIEKEFDGSPELHDTVSIKSVASSASEYNGHYESTLQRNRNSEFNRCDPLTGQPITYPPEDFGMSDMADSSRIVAPHIYKHFIMPADESLPQQNGYYQNGFIEPREESRQNESLNIAPPIKNFMQRENVNKLALNDRSNTANQTTTQSQSNYHPRQKLKKRSRLKPAQQFSGIPGNHETRQTSKQKQQKNNPSTCLPITFCKSSIDNAPIRNATDTEQEHLAPPQEKQQEEEEQQPHNFDEELEREDRKFRELRKRQLQELQTQQQQLQIKLDQQIQLQQQEEEKWEQGRKALKLQTLSNRLEQAKDKDSGSPNVQASSTEPYLLSTSPGHLPVQPGHKKKLSQTSNGSTSNHSSPRGFTQKLLPTRFFKRRNSAVPVFNSNYNTSAENLEQIPTNNGGGGKLGPLKRGFFSGSSSSKTGKRGKHRLMASEGDALKITRKGKRAEAAAPSHASASKSLGAEQDLYNQFPIQYQPIVARSNNTGRRQSNKSSTTSKRHQKKQARKGSIAAAAVPKATATTTSPVSSKKNDNAEQHEILGGVRRISFLKGRPRKSLFHKQRASSDSSTSSTTSSPSSNTSRLDNAKSPEPSQQPLHLAATQKYASTATSRNNGKKKISSLSAGAAAATEENMYTKLFQDEPTLDPRILARMRDPTCTIPGTWLEEWAVALARDISRFRDMKRVHEQMYHEPPLVPVACATAAAYEQSDINRR
jgi:hypothetical protein